MTANDPAPTWPDDYQTVLLQNLQCGASRLTTHLVLPSYFRLGRHERPRPKHPTVDLAPQVIDDLMYPKLSGHDFPPLSC